MWYVLHTLSGREQEALDLMERRAEDGLMQEFFVPRRELMRKQKGEWITFPENLFPGYAFVRTNNPDLVNKLAKDIPFYARILGGEEGFMPLSESEKLQIQGMMDSEMSIVRISKGVIVGDTVMVLQGPLRGKEGHITKIDRHKRIAQLEMSFLGRLVTIKLGLEIVYKT